MECYIWDDRCGYHALCLILFLQKQIQRQTGIFLRLPLKVAHLISESGVNFFESGAHLSKSSVHLSKSGAHLFESGASFSGSGAPFSESGVPFSESGVPFSESGAPFSESGAPFSESGAPFSESDNPGVLGTSQVLKFLINKTLKLCAVILWVVPSFSHHKNFEISELNSYYRLQDHSFKVKLLSWWMTPLHGELP